MTTVYFNSQELRIVCAECGEELPQQDRNIGRLVADKASVSVEPCLECLNKVRKTYYDKLKKDYREKYDTSKRIKFRREK